MLQAHDGFIETEFHEDVVSQLVSIIKDVDFWGILCDHEHSMDYYNYHVFRIVERYIMKILP